MKYILFIFLTSLLFCSCSMFRKNDIRKESDFTVVVDVSKKYLLIPAEDKGEEIKIHISVEGKPTDYFIGRPAQTQIDHWIPVDVSGWKGKQVSFTFENLKAAALCWNNIRQSDNTGSDGKEDYRPIYHFAPAFGWMNDPNGMVYYDGTYHLCYQHNPYGTRWQNMSWGHAVTKNLVSWQHLPEALCPDSLGTIFSGCTVVDQTNSADLQTGEEKTLLTFFTHSERQGQFQSLAYSNDKGKSWQKYSGNPILRHETARDFRDPKVFWYAPDQKWVMILAVGQVMEIYSSADAVNWAYESRFGEGQGAHGGVWECPDLFELPVEGISGKSKWVMICNLNPGGPAGGSGCQYFVGSFDGKTFRNEADSSKTNWLDWGKDHYAAVSWSDVPRHDGRRIIIGWMNNWEYANDVPTRDFRSAMTIPRELKLVETDGNYQVYSYPVREVAELRKESRTLEPFTVTDSFYKDDLLKDNEGAYEINLNIENTTSEIMGFKLFNTQGECMEFSINTVEGKLMINRNNSGKTDFSPHFAAVTSAPVGKKKSYILRLLVDKASIECFEGNGEIAITNIIFPSEPYNRINFYSKGGQYTVTHLEINKLSN